MKREMLTSGQVGKAQDNIIASSCKYLMDHPNVKSLILGMSGGIDSAVTGVIAREVCDLMEHKGRDIELIIRSLPIMSNSQSEIKRAENIGRRLSSNYKTECLDAEFNALREGLQYEEAQQVDMSSHEYKVRMGNIKARIRMIYLYNLASIHNGMVLSTDNYTELLLGFWTLHGDVGDYGMIQNLWKTEVFALADYYVTHYNIHDDHKLGQALRACRNATPTDGLGITESDMDQFGEVETYEQVDEIFIDILNNGYSKLISEGGTIPKVLTMHQRTMFKRNNPYNIPREVITDNIR